MKALIGLIINNTMEKLIRMISRITSLIVVNKLNQKMIHLLGVIFDKEKLLTSQCEE